MKKIGMIAGLAAVACVCGLALAGSSDVESHAVPALVDEINTRIVTPLQAIEGSNTTLSASVIALGGSNTTHAAGILALAGSNATHKARLDGLSTSNALWSTAAGNYAVTSNDVTTAKAQIVGLSTTNDTVWGRLAVGTSYTNVLVESSDELQGIATNTIIFIDGVFKSWTRVP